MSTEVEPAAEPGAAEVEATSQALAGVWTGANIGGSATGSSSGSGSNFTVTGAGPDIWSTADGFRFHYMTVTGDVTITARVASITAASGTLDTFAKAGVMMRQNLTTGSPNVMMLLTPTATNGFRFQNRATAGGTTARVFAGSAAGTGWVRLTRTGTTFRSYYSTNGTSWTELTPAVTIGTMSGAIEVGLAVTSRSTTATALAQAVFDNVVFNPPQAPPGPPSPAPVLQTPIAGNNEVALSWTASGNVASYEVTRSQTQGTGHTNIATGLGATSTSYTDLTALNGTTYYYRVVARNANGTTPSNEQSATPAPPQPPGQPQGLGATGGNGQVSLSWNPTPTATGYKILFNTTGNGALEDYVQAGTSPASPTPSFTHTPIPNGTPHYYVVVATNSGGDGPMSQQVNATPQAPPVPAKPTNLVATGSAGQVSLSWFPADNATSYILKRSTTNGGPYSTIQSGIAGTSAIDSNVTSGTTYHYVVAGYNGVEGPQSDQASAAPTAPVWQSQDINSGSQTGSYSESTGTHTVRGGGADIYGTADAFRFAYQTVTGDVTITARVTGLSLFSGGGTINVWAKAGVMIRDSVAAGSRNLMVLTSPTASNKYRRQLRATANGSSSSTPSAANSDTSEWLRLQRTGNSFQASHSNDGNTWTPIGSAITQTLNSQVLVGLAVTSHSTTQIVTGTFTNVTVTTPAPPPVPTGFSAQGQNNQVFLQWGITPNASSYTVEHGPASTGPWTQAGSGITDTFRAVLGLTNGTPRWFRVSAQNPAGSSAFTTPISATPTQLRPSVSSVAPADGSTGVDPLHAYVNCEITAPNYGGGIDSATLIDANVFLRRTSDGAAVPATLGTSGGADVISLTPSVQLDDGTEYTFTVTTGLRDATGAPFMPFTSSFTTGIAAPPDPSEVAFERLNATATQRMWTSIAMGPDNKIYAGTITGHIHRFNINADGTLGGELIINSVRAGNGNTDRALIGMTFEPNVNPPVLWVTNGGRQLTEAPNWTGKLARLSGTNLGTYQDYVVNFPRSYKDHMTNSIAFRPGEPNVVYITQGSQSAMGAPDTKWGMRKEQLLSGAILRVNLAAITSPPLNIMTNDNDETSAPGANGRYNPFAVGAPVTIFATGVRNAYDLLWHSNGELYSATNGSAGGGNSPGVSSPWPAACTRRIDDAFNGDYTGPSVPAITSTLEDADFLYKVQQNGYYGHPNPSRCEWVRHGGNPTSGTDSAQVPAYSTGTQPDRNWRGTIFDFGLHHSPNGMIEWKGTQVPALLGKLLIVRYANGGDIIVLTIDPVTKNVVDSDTDIPGFTGMTDPLDLVQNQSNGHIYVTDYNGQRIFLLRPTQID